MTKRKSAIYARQSVDKADSISIDSQIEYCQYELRGADYIVFSDRGYSGKNTQRPAYQQMMSAVERGEIDKVVVYKLDRISRSILDFSSMMEDFSRFDVDFVSCSEKFDTSSPVGRAMLNICIVFAQLERETIQQRVRDNYISRCSRGLYMGGHIPFGYRASAAEIGGIKTTILVPDPEESSQILDIHEMYSLPELSCADVAQCMTVRGYTKRSTPWSGARVSEIAGNPLYVKADERVYRHYMSIGVEIISPLCDFTGKNGCYLYKIGSSSNQLQRKILVLAPHEGIIDTSIWLKCVSKKRI